MSEPRTLTLTVTELRAQLGAVLDAVEAGERVVITRYGKPVAALVSIGYGLGVGDALDTIASGLEP